jgi:hypothetical protein
MEFFFFRNLVPVAISRGNYYPQNVLSLNTGLALTSPTSGSRSVSIIRSRTKTTEFKLTLSGIHKDRCAECSDTNARNFAKTGRVCAYWINLA